MKFMNFLLLGFLSVSCVPELSDDNNTEGGGNEGLTISTTASLSLVLGENNNFSSTINLGDIPELQGSEIIGIEATTLNHGFVQGTAGLGYYIYTLQDSYLSSLEELGQNTGSFTENVKVRYLVDSVEDDIKIDLNVFVEAPELEEEDSFRTFNLGNRIELNESNSFQVFRPDLSLPSNLGVAEASVIMLNSLPMDVSISSVNGQRGYLFKRNAIGQTNTAFHNKTITISSNDFKVIITRSSGVETIRFNGTYFIEGDSISTSSLTKYYDMDDRASSIVYNDFVKTLGFTSNEGAISVVQDINPNILPGSSLELERYHEPNGLGGAKQKFSAKLKVPTNSLIVPGQLIVRRFKVKITLYGIDYFYDVALPIRIYSGDSYRNFTASNINYSEDMVNTTLDYSKIFSNGISKNMLGFYNSESSIISASCTVTLMDWDSLSSSDVLIEAETLEIDSLTSEKIKFKEPKDLFRNIFMEDRLHSHEDHGIGDGDAGKADQFIKIDCDGKLYSHGDKELIDFENFTAVYYKCDNGNC